MPRKAHGGRHAQLATGRIARGRQLGPRLLGRRTHGSTLGVVALARLGQGQFAGRAVQQRHAPFPLQLPHLLADR